MSLPDLSKWHEVPVGAALTKGTKYVVLHENGMFYSAEVYNEWALDAALAVRVFTAEPVERPLADVLRGAYLADEDWDNVAVVAQQWLTRQQADPETHRDACGDVWIKQADGSYIWQAMRCANLTELIEEHGDWEG